MKISAVIPTRNRPAYIQPLLDNIALQTYPVAEIIIVDASDDLHYKDDIAEKFSAVPLRWIASEASVCIQRNLGIAQATSPWIFLCDDDMRFPKDYVETLVNTISQHPECAAASGLFMQLENDTWVYRYPFKNFRGLLWAYVFRLSVWGEVKGMNVSALVRPAYARLCKFYECLGNSVSVGGWPVITNFDTPFFVTKTYSLGSSLIKKEMLQASPFDEVLDPSGIGDNYGVALAFPNDAAIVVTHRTQTYNAKAPENRLEYALAYYRRILALHYFLTTNARFKKSNRRWLAWSLVGLLMSFAVKGQLRLAYANLKALILIARNRNPYVEGAAKNKKVVRPSL
ncbi:glycosyltransferase family 2 protein [Chryseolinea lacunae]|uniref:Glycosyltransferase family 2 protein n=1 Tax=Chryseolinea lacunae TaxID=2801331 RepID=A0ABS1KSI0_9BACT|nr:glycosyltransferase family A protein [Chryseolinea lacunae]MBL0742268.1 glycosyltransferase family 2 protein [Chryseolinea lacunae]